MTSRILSGSGLSTIHSGLLSHIVGGSIHLPCGRCPERSPYWAGCQYMTPFHYGGNCVQSVPQKLKGLIRAPQALGFPFVDRKLQPRHEPLHCRQHFCRRSLAKHTQVIRVIHDLRTEPPGIAQYCCFKEIFMFESSSFDFA